MLKKVILANKRRLFFLKSQFVTSSFGGKSFVANLYRRSSFLLWRLLDLYGCRMEV